MSWGINETAPEIEKIKSESADYLNGLNSCGVIDWNTYNYAFDFYADLLMKAYEQGRKDAQLEPCEDVVNRQRLLDDLKKLKTAWKKYPVMAEQIKGVEAAIGYADAYRWLYSCEEVQCMWSGADNSEQVLSELWRKNGWI